MRTRKPDTLGLVLVLLPFVGAALCWLWAGNSALVAADRLTLVVAAVLGGTAVLAAVDASRLGFGEDGDAAKESGPIGTFLAVGLAWALVFPVYMFKRAKYGVRHYGGPATLGAVVFVGTVAVVAMWLHGVGREVAAAQAQVQREVAELEQAVATVARLPTDSEVALGEYAALIDEVCACTSKACLDTTSPRLAALAETRGGAISGAEIPRADAESERLVACAKGIVARAAAR